MSENTTKKKRIGNNEDLQTKWKRREMERWRDGRVDMGEGRLRQKERIDRENAINQGGCILVRRSKGEGAGERGESFQPQWLSGKHACRAL